MLILLAAVVLSVGLFGSGRAGMRLVALELMVGAGALSVGALLGFLFGIPRTLTRDAPAEAAGGGAQGSGAAGDADAHPLSYQPSTNLEQVSDWLTKILIGVGLVEFDKASGALARVGRRVQEQVGAGVPGADVLTQAVIIVLAVVGFLASFLWTRIYYGAIQAGADNQAVQALRAQVSRQAESTAEAQKKAEGAQKVTEAMLRGEINVPPVPAMAPAPAPPQVQEPRVMRIEGRGWPPELRERVNRFVAAPREWDSDPTGDLFGDAPAAANGRALTARVEAELGRGLMITLCLERTADSPLQGTVTFLLHPTFPDRIHEVPVRDGAAQTKIYSGGTFTVVAIADEGRTVLAFNLNRLSSAPDWFLAN